MISGLDIFGDNTFARKRCEICKVCYGYEFEGETFICDGCDPFCTFTHVEVVVKDDGICHECAAKELDEYQLSLF